MKSRANETADVIVVGAGVIGLAIAHEATSRGARVVVVNVDRAGAASRAAAGMIAPASEAAHRHPALARLTLESARLYPEWIDRIERESGTSIGLRREPALLVALTADDRRELEHLAETQSGLGLHEVRWLDRRGVRALEPALHPRVVGALLAERDHQVDPRALCAGLRASLTRKSACIIDVASLRLLDDGWRVSGVAVDAPRSIDILAPRVVVAAGIWSEDLLPAPSLPLRPVKGQLLRLSGARLLSSVVRTPEVYLVPRTDGTLIVGASSEEVGRSIAPTAGVVLDLLLAARNVLPGVHELAVEELVCGLRPALSDHLPAVGAFALDGLFVATGHHRHGVTLAPLTAAILAGVMFDGKQPPSEISPARFSAEAGRAA